MKIKKDLNRRDFIGMAVAGSSVLFTQSCGTLNNQSTSLKTTPLSRHNSILSPAATLFFINVIDNLISFSCFVVYF